jgi:hypothetical protein
MPWWSPDQCCCRKETAWGETHQLACGSESVTLLGSAQPSGLGASMASARSRQAMEAKGPRLVTSCGTVIYSMLIVTGYGCACRQTSRNQHVRDFIQAHHTRVPHLQREQHGRTTHW